VSEFYLIPRKNLLWIAVDLDGTLCWPTWKPQQLRSTIGDLIPGAREKIEELVETGYKPFIHTARPWTDYEMIEAWLQEEELPITRIICGKVLAACYVDDKAVNARAGSWIPGHGWDK
jgi:hypothetical protein